MGSEDEREAGEPGFGRGYPRSGSTDSGGGRAPGSARRSASLS
jgi:hypothetical protein